MDPKDLLRVEAVACRSHNGTHHETSEEGRRYLSMAESG
jgi:hypothetical protein